MGCGAEGASREEEEGRRGEHERAADSGERGYSDEGASCELPAAHALQPLPGPRCQGCICALHLLPDAASFLQCHVVLRNLASSQSALCPYICALDPAACISGSIHNLITSRMGHACVCDLGSDVGFSQGLRACCMLACGACRSHGWTDEKAQGPGSLRLFASLRGVGLGALATMAGR